MEIILSRHCESLTGSLGRGFGYHIQHRKNGFFGKRNSRGYVPCTGHWRFIVACAELAKIGLHIRDIKLPVGEFHKALRETFMSCPARAIDGVTYLNAEDVLRLKEKYNL